MEAYKIGITVALTNRVSSILGVIARDFVKTDIEAKALKKTLSNIKMLSLTGMAAGGAGFLGLEAMKAIVKPATEYTHQLELMASAGMKQQEIAEATRAAWDATRQVQTTTASENLKAIRELRMVFGDTLDATKFVPQMQKLQGVLDAYLGAGHAKSTDVAFAAAKALELRGASVNPQTFQQQADLIARGVIASGGKVTPANILAAIKYGGVGATGYSNDFMYGILPTLAQELGGPQTGTALTSMYRAIVGGRIDQRALAEFKNLGLVDMSKAIFTTTGALKGIKSGGIKGGDIFQKNPLQWVQEVLVPAMVKHGYKTQEQQQALLDQLYSNRNAAKIGNILQTQAPRLQKDFGLIGEAGTTAEYDRLLKADPITAQKALATQWENLKTALGTAVIPFLVPALTALTGALTGMAKWAKDHPTLAKTIVLTTAALTGLALLFGGIALVAAGIIAIGAIPFAGTAALIAGALAAVGIAIMVFWDDIKALGAWTATGLYKLWDWLKTLTWQDNPLTHLWSWLTGLTWQDNPVTHLWNWLTGLDWKQLPFIRQIMALLPGSAADQAAKTFSGEDQKKGDFTAPSNQPFRGFIKPPPLAPAPETPNTVAAPSPFRFVKPPPLAPAPETPNTVAAPSPFRFVKPPPLAPAPGAAPAVAPDRSLRDGAPSAEGVGAPGPQSYAPPPTSLTAIQVNSSINVDGRELARVVTRQQVKDGNRPNQGTTAFDPSIGPMVPAMSGP